MKIKNYIAAKVIKVSNIHESWHPTAGLFRGDLHREGHGIFEEFEATCVAASTVEWGTETEYVPEEGKRDACWNEAS